MLRRLLLSAPLILLCAAVEARAGLGPGLKLTMVSEPVPARVGVPYEGTLRVAAGRTVTVDGFRFETNAWSGRLVDAPSRVTLEAGDTLDLRFTATTIDPEQPLTFVFDADDRSYGRSFDLDARHLEREVGAAKMQVVEEGGDVPRFGVESDTRLRATDPQRPAAKDAAVSLATVIDESHDIDPDRELGLDKRRNITIEGRFVYRRQDGRTTGVDNATVRVYDEDSGPDNKVAQGLTDVDGYYSFTFDWDPCLVCDKRPDIYVEFELTNSKVTVETAGLEYNYKWATGTLGDFEGSYHDFGSIGPADEDLQPAPHMFNHVLRTWRWIVNETPHDPPSVDVQWPGNGAFYNPFFEEIHIDHDREWNEDTCAHEYGHHFIENFADFQSPSYCNGICDDREEWYEVWENCGHCLWCEETDHDAWNEGWPNWLADVVTRFHRSNYGYGLLNLRDFEDVDDCFVDNAYDDPRITEGFLAALLRDIEDYMPDNEPDFDGFDKLSWGWDEIFTVTVQDQPRTPVEFLANFLTRYATSPQVEEDIWFTAMNNGFQTDNANPGPVSNLSSTSHSIGVDSPDNTIEFSWTTATDDRSGIQGYGISIASGASLPSAVMDIGDVTGYTTESLAPGTYYFNIRAIDNAGKWSSSYRSVGPFVIRNPFPANLVFDTNPGWGAFVVPRTTNDSGPTFVPAPSSLPGNTRGTWWNSRAQNVGETSIACCPRVNVRVDGFNVFSSPFDPQDVYDLIAGLGPNTADNSLNQGPIWVSGGRHVFGAFIDSGEEVAETDETDNKTARQWVWTPITLSPGSTVSRNHPADRDGGWGESSGTLWYNADGLRFDSSAWWTAVWAHSQNDEADIDIRLHQPSSSATSGFESNEGYSSRGPGRLDAVIVNRNVSGSQNWDVGVLQATSSYESGLYHTRHVDNTSFSFGDSAETSIASGEMLQLREVFVPTSGVGPVSVTVQLDPALGPDFPALQVGWLDETFGTGDINDVNALAVTDVVDGFLRLDVDVPEDGYNALVIYRDPTEGSAAWDFTLEVDRSPPDWLPKKPTNWYAPVVPHLSSADLVNLTAPTALYGNVPQTYVSLSLTNAGGTGSNGPFQARTRIDGLDVTGSVWSDWPAGLTRTVLGRGPLTIDGGRHTLTLVCDPENEYEEIFENNNVFGEQWIWSPLSMQLGVPVTRDQPQSRTVGWTEISTNEGKWFNADGLRTPVFAPSGQNGYWGAVAVLPAPGGDVDIRWHAPSTGPKNGFATNLRYSGWGPDQSDLLLVNFNETTFGELDVGVLNADGSAGGGAGYTAEVLQSTYLGAPTAVPVGPFTIADGHVAQVYEVSLSAGVIVVQVQNHSGEVDLGVSLYASGQAHMAKSDALGAAWFAPAGEDEWITVEIPETGFYGLAVWKNASEDLSVSADYSVRFGTDVTDAPTADVSSRVSRIAAVTPNPFNPRTTVAFDLSRGGSVTLEVVNVRGERVRTLVGDATLTVGRHEVVWDGEDDGGRAVASGTYFVVMRSPDGRDQRKVTLLK